MNLFCISTPFLFTIIWLTSTSYECKATMQSQEVREGNGVELDGYGTRTVQVGNSSQFYIQKGRTGHPRDEYQVFPSNANETSYEQLNETGNKGGFILKATTE